MSRAGGVVHIDARLAEIHATLGFVPSCLVAALGEGQRDFIDHLKKSTLKRVALTFPSKDRAQRMIASRFFGYSGTARRDYLGGEGPPETWKLDGEAFIASRSGVGQLDPRNVQAYQEGRDVKASEWMAVPTKAGMPYTGAFQNVPIWQRVAGGLREFLFVTVKRKNGGTVVLIVDDRKRTESKMKKKGLTGWENLPVVGIFVKRRLQRKLLQFYEAAAEIAPKHAAKMDRDVEKAMTAAGREALAFRNETVLRARQAWASAYDSSLSTSLSAGPLPSRGAGSMQRLRVLARRAADAAARDVRRSSIAKGGG